MHILTRYKHFWSTLGLEIECFIKKLNHIAPTEGCFTDERSWDLGHLTYRCGCAELRVQQLELLQYCC